MCNPNEFEEDRRLSNPLNLSVSNYIKRASEHLFKSDAFFVLPRVVAEHSLIDIALQVFGRNKVIDAKDGTFQLSPKALDAVGVCISYYKLLRAVMNNGMGVLAVVQRLVTNELIRKNARAFLHELTNDRGQSIALCVAYLMGNQLSSSLYHSEHRCLGLC